MANIKCIVADITCGVADISHGVVNIMCGMVDILIGVPDILHVQHHFLKIFSSVREFSKGKIYFFPRVL